MTKKDCPPGFTPTSNYEYIIDCFVPDVLVPAAGGCAPQSLPPFEPVPRFPCPVFTGDVNGEVRFVSGNIDPELTRVIDETPVRDGNICRTEIKLNLDFLIA